MSERLRYSYKSQLEFLRGRIKTEHLISDEDTSALICMYESLVASVHSAMHKDLKNELDP